MSSRAVNLLLLLLVSLEIVSGLASFLVGGPDGRWVFWLHRIGGFAILVLLGWKWRIVTRGYQRRGVGAGTFTSGLFGLVVLAALGTGLLWATTGLPGLRVPVLGKLTGLGIHVTLSLALVPLFLWHTVARWPRARRADFVGRRAAARYLSLGAAGLVLWQASEGVNRLAAFSGVRRRFTGSREVGSLRGNRFPTTNWLFDPIPRLDAGSWSLRLHGAVERERHISYDDLLAHEGIARRATLDCTGGWFTVQDWRGVPLTRLVTEAGMRPGARSLLVCSETGYARRFALDELDDLLLATHVGDEPLSVGHGYPTRLVAPGRRGFEWVKWVVVIEVSDAPPWLEWPLPPK